MADQLYRLCVLDRLRTMSRKHVEALLYVDDEPYLRAAAIAELERRAIDAAMKEAENG